MKKPKPVDLPEVEVFDCEQGSEDRAMLRLGIPTASVFATIMASGKDGGESKMRNKLLNQIAGERLCGEPAENYSNAYMDRGIAMEAEAREHYAFTRGVELERVGFVRRRLSGGLARPDRFVGCSPDSFIGERRVLEVKTMAPHLLIDLAKRGVFPTEHRAQCHGTLWVTGRDEIDLMVFYRGMPVAPSFTLERDEVYIREIAERVEVFDYEVSKLVEQIRNMARR